MVTVHMAVYNTPAELLRESIGSILRQTLRDFEFLIVDDGSSEPETVAELERQAASDDRIRLEKSPHVGVTRMLNLGLAKASRELIARQDADDWSDPERLERQTDFLRGHPEMALCGSNAWSHRHDGAPLWKTQLPEAAREVDAAFWRQNPFVHGSTMFRAAAARKLGGYRDDFPCAPDYDFLWRLADTGGAVNLPEPLYHYRYSKGSVSVRRAAEQARVHRASQILAMARRLGQAPADCDPERALATAEREMQAAGGALRAALKQADHRMLAGDTWGSGRVFCELLASHAATPLAWGKLLRWALFSSVPPVRRMCFR